MTKKIHGNNLTSLKRKSNSSWRVATRSQFIFDTLYYKGGKQGLIDATPKNLAAAKRMIDLGGSKYSPTSHPVVVSNSTGSSTKLASTILTSGIAGSPIREQSDASARARTFVFTVNTVLELAHNWYNAPDAHCYMLTITAPNAARKTLKKHYTSLSTTTSQVMKALKDGTNNSNGLRLVANKKASATYAKWLGSYIDMEITLNPDALTNKSDDNLYHHHSHTLLMFDHSLDLDTEVTLQSTDPKRPHYIRNMTRDMCVLPFARSQLFEYWCNKHPRTLFSPSAFKLNETYTNDTLTNTTVQGVDKLDTKKAALRAQIAAGMEAAGKYTIKPDFYKNLPMPDKHGNIDDYYVRVFSETYRCTAHARTRRASGIFYKAASFVQWAKVSHVKGRPNSNLFNAILSGKYKDQSVGNRVPDYLTRVKLFDGYQLNTVTTMDSQMILYYNSAMLSNVVFDSSLLRTVNFPVDERGQMFKFLLNHIKFVEKNGDDEYDVDAVRRVVRNQLDNMSVIVSKLTTDYNKLLGISRFDKSSLKPDLSDAEIEKAKQIKDAIDVAKSKRSDVALMSDALATLDGSGHLLFDHSDTRFDHYDYTSIMKAYDYIRTFYFYDKKNNHDTYTFENEAHVDYWNSSAALYDRQNINEVFGGSYATEQAHKAGVDCDEELLVPVYLLYNTSHVLNQGSYGNVMRDFDVLGEYEYLRQILNSVTGKVVNDSDVIERFEQIVDYFESDYKRELNVSCRVNSVSDLQEIVAQISDGELEENVDLQQMQNEIDDAVNSMFM